MDLRAKVLEFLYEKQAGSEKPAATLKVA